MTPVGPTLVKYFHFTLIYYIFTLLHVRTNIVHCTALQPVLFSWATEVVAFHKISCVTTD